MKRIIAAILLIGVLAVSLLATSPFWLNSTQLTDLIKTELKTVAGRQVSFQGDARITLNPFFGIELPDFIISGNPIAPDQKPLLRAEAAQIRLDPFNAIFGGISINTVELKRPTLYMLKGNDGSSNWQVRDQTDDAASQVGNIIGNAEQITITIRDGNFAYRNEITGSEETAAHINGILELPDRDGTLSFDGNAIYRNEPIQSTISINEFSEFTSAKGSDVALNFASEPLNLRFEGMANASVGLFAVGTVSANSPSLSRFNQLFGFDFDTSDISGNWNVSGSLDLKPESLLLSDAKVSIGEHEASGVVRIARNELGKNKIDGTLAFSEIELSNASQSIAHNSFISNLENNDFEIDLRLSAEKLITPHGNLETVAASISKTEASWKMEIGDAAFMNGNLVALIELAKSEGEPMLTFNAEAKNAVLSSIETIAQNAPITISTPTNIKIDLHSYLPQEGTPLKINGTIELNATDGELVGISLPLISQGNAASNNDVETIASLAGKTDFKEFTSRVLIFDNSGFIPNISITSDDYEVNFKGIMNLLSGSISMEATQSDGDGNPLERLQIGGSFSDPLITLKPAPEPIKQDLSAPESTETQAAPQTEARTSN